MKHCKYCYSNIHEKAKVCPECNHRLSMVGGLQAFLVTAFPILTAVLSLGFAFYEKYEKGLVQDSLVQTENRLEFAEVKSEVAEEAVEQLAQMVPRVSAIRMVPMQGVENKTPNQLVDEIESDFSSKDYSASLDKHALSKQMMNRLELKTGISIFKSADR